MSAWEGSSLQAAQEQAARGNQAMYEQARRQQIGPQNADDHISMLKKRAEALRAELKSADAKRAELEKIDRMLAALEPTP